MANRASKEDEADEKRKQKEKELRKKKARKLLGDGAAGSAIDKINKRRKLLDEL